MKNDWWTSPTVSDNGKVIMVTGRRDVDKFRKNSKYSIRVEVTFTYVPDGSGMPDLETSILMGRAHDALQSAFDKDSVAVMTGVYTGDGERNWVFYTLSTNIFGRKLNEALAPLPILPLSIYAENDPEWLEYEEMKSISEIITDDE